MKNILKRGLSIFLAMAIIFSSALVGLNELDFNGLFAVKAEAASVDDLTFTLNDDGKSYSVTDCDTAAEGELVIPSKYNGLPVTSIGDWSLYYCKNLTSVTIPNSVTSIGNDAFYYCESLISVTIPDSVIKIGSSAFYVCKNLTNVFITDIGAWCNIDFVDVYSNPLSYADNLYINGEFSATIVIPDGVTNIPAYTFRNNTNLISITIPDSVTQIEAYAFYNCPNLISVTIPNSVTSIGRCAFQACTNLTSITIPSSVTDIGDSAFTNTGYYNDNTNWENDVLYIGNHLIKASTLLYGEYEIKDGTKTIAIQAFKDCIDVTSITVPESITSISSSTFYNCKSLTSIKIPNSVTNISNRVFYGCTSLSSITIPDSVTSLGDYVFYGCKSLTSITIPDSVTSLGASVFGDCTGLVSITLSSNVKSISSRSFINCRSLTSITIPDGVTSIVGESFINCTSLVSITIPDSVVSIGEMAFVECDSLTTVYYSGTEEQWNNINIERYNSSLLSANIIFNNSGSSEPDEPLINEFNGTFTVAQKYGDTYSHQYDYSYKDTYFNNPATVYNHELATMSLSLALSTFQLEDTNTKYNNAVSLLNECGFTNGKIYNYDFTTTADNVGCLIFQKQIGDETLIAVVVRSGGYGKEWASNLTLGYTGDHKGFDEAAGIVVSRIKEYIQTKNISGDIKIWLTGYSRGAATATQTAAKLNFETIAGVNFTKEKIYAYGFATPAGAIKDSDPTNSEKYGNIFNILNFHDIVPRVAPEKWGFGRYGKTYYFPFSENSLFTAGISENNVKNWFVTQNLDYKVDDFIATYSEIPIVTIPISNDTIGVFSKKLVNDIAASIGSRSLYVDKKQTSLRAVWTENNLSSAIVEVLEILQFELLVKPQYIKTAIAANTKLVEAHSAYGAYYMGWMQTIPADNALEYLNNGDMRQWLVNCPVDAYVYDTSGNLVAAIENDMPVEIEGSSFSYGVDENGQKYFYLPVDAEYNITVKARDDCETTCTVNEFSGGSFTESRVVTFTEIPMEKNEELSVSTGVYSEEDITEGTENGSSVDYTIQREDEEIIEPDIDVAGEEIENYTYKVTVEYDENKGIVYGGGTFTIGQFCQVTAENKPGYRFSKWTVNGETVSTDSTYRFAVKEDVTIVAEYVPCEHLKYIDEVVAPTCTEEGYTKHTCEVCTYSYNDTTVNANGHTLSDWITDKKATVYSAGSKHKECTVCDEIVETAQIPQLKCSKPSIKSASNDGKNVKVTWKKVSGADTYYVYRKVKGGSYSYLGKTTKTYYVDKTAKAGKTYTYKLRAKNEAGYSSYSSTKTVKHLDQPTLKTATNTSSGVKITWSKVSKVSGYKVYRKTSDGWKYLGKTTKTYFTDKTVKSGKKYTYSVKAYSGDYNSSYSLTGVSRYYLADPTLKTPNSTKKGVKLEWSKVTGAEGYMVYRKTGSGSYSRIATVKGSSKVTYTDKSAKKGKTYTYKVKAYKSKTYSAYSNTPKIKDKY